MRLFKYIFLLFFFFSCDSDDTTSEVTDIRYKVLLDYDGDLVFIGDQTNKVIFESSSSEYYLSILGYYNKVQSKRLYFISRSDFYSGFKLNYIDLQDLYENRDYNYTVQSSVINFDENDYLMSGVFMESENRYHFLVTEDDSNILLKTFENGSLVETQNVTSTFGIPNFGIEGISYFQASNKLVIIQDVFNSSAQKTMIIDLDTFSLVEEHTNFNYNFFKGFGDAEHQFLIGRKEISYQVHEYLTDLQGDLITDNSDTYTFIGSASIGYDTEDSAFEYFIDGDGREEVGTINTFTGELLRQGVEGEPHSRNSPIFYFKPN
ncbi:hypothetical protein HSX10_07765 [Winogradskyella undariae]|uniref:hypothetical protein n=1 Tax=Winogradskyella TaxID=286104 RepID=UPI00156B7F2B|nr:MULTISPECIES: hypothetical protein [Winogradskyella]NRR91457.1 hypothetical protein [Winogradskyella undariae]QXP80583.1 hypothetical protein H0I32_08185 [Winogradskyella sp. HaHa_3_26]